MNISSTNNYKIVFFDIDGTLINKDGIIPATTKEAISKLKESKIEVVKRTVSA
ncbi:MAG: HAD family hydrolase [Candidatus Pristimantibacillus sp.]